MPKWGESWDDFGQPDISGWTDMVFSEFIWKDKDEDATWLLLKFDRDGAKASMSLNFFPVTDHAGRAKCHEISMGKLGHFFRGCGEEVDLEPEAIRKALERLSVMGLQIGCRVGKDDKDYNEVKDFRKAK